MPYIPLITLSAAVTGGLAFFCWQRRRVAGGAIFSATLFLGSAWMLAIALMLGRKNTGTAEFWYRVSLMFAAVLPVLLLYFALAYYGRKDWLSRVRIALAFLVPLITCFLVWTDPLHRLFFRHLSVVRKNGLMLIDSWTPGPWFVVHSIYSFSLVLIAVILLWIVAFRQIRIYRYQSMMIIAGTMATILPNLGFALGLIPPDVIVLPFGFLLMAGLLTWSIFRHRLFDIVPVARNRLLDIMGDGMIVLDDRDRIVDLNPAALSAMDMTEDSVVGRPAAQIFGRLPGVMDRFETVMQDQTEFSITLDKTTAHYDVRISQLSTAAGHTAGRLILFRDITNRKLTEQALVAERDKLKAAVARINELSGLLPICASCKKIRDDKGYWNQIESYISKHSQAEFSHSICPDCMADLYGDEDWYRKKYGNPRK